MAKPNHPSAPPATNAATSSAPLIALRDVSFAYGADPVLSHINLEVHRGEYLGVIGPNGGGKTTLLRLMLGLLEPASGSIELFGRTIGSFKDWPAVGYVSQRVIGSSGRLPISVEEVVMLGRTARAGLFHRLGAKDRAAVTAAMEKVDILPLRHRLITELSGGQQQRVFIAKALAADPKILILDEPTVGIDIKSQDAFYQLLSELNRSGHLTLVMVSHDIDVIVGEVTRIACINETLVYHGAPAEFVKEDYMTKLYGKQRKFILHGH
jgi:zinc transport system ATP-binding protein